ncbi:TetR/AcrR family transcriptional regulator [Microbacterium sp. No. 7]|uniref:TetR/AcrR family transcriptional regulator n=1 Tax=Microbacterium sp. No. 7 TaxID=1714373 RepID=UPI0006D1A63F|nr:TetR family transcriptional regulator [Microbacterium sp. No. 7]
MLTDFREQARETSRIQLAEAVFTVFAERGFHAVTVDEAARAVGISRASFFRHLGSKEDAVVLAIESSRPDYAAALRELPADVRSPWHLVRCAFEPAIVAAEAEPQRQLARIAVIHSEPNLRVRLSSSRMGMVARLADALDERIHDPFGAHVYAAAGMAAYDVAWSEWAGNPEISPRTHVDAAFARLAAAR